MWYEPPTEEPPHKTEEQAKQPGAAPRFHVWSAPWPVDKGGPTLHHATKCTVCNVPGLRVNRTGKAGKGRSIPEAWCPEQCPGAPRDWETIRKRVLEDPVRNDVTATDDTAETARTLVSLLKDCERRVCVL
jgi:hypothetical protein